MTGRPRGGGAGSSGHPPDGSSDGLNGRPQTVHAASNVTSAQHTASQLAHQGRPPTQSGPTSGSGSGGSSQPQHPQDVEVTYGPTELAHWRSHAQDIREVARAEGVDIPRSPARPETQQGSSCVSHFGGSSSRPPTRAGASSSRGRWKTSLPSSA